MSARVVQAAARGIVLKSNPSLLSENGSSVELSKEWAHKLLCRMGFVKQQLVRAVCLSVILKTQKRNFFRRL